MKACPIVVVHRQRIVAESLAAALSVHRGISVVAYVTTIADAERASRWAEAIVMDDALEGAALSGARFRQAGLKVILLGDQVGAAPYMQTGGSVGELAAALLSDPSRGSSSSAGPLTPRENEVLSLVASGLAGKQVATRLGISPKTVEQHKTRIFTKLGVPNQTAAVSVAMSWGLRMGASSLPTEMETA